jgi:hypothetical protein
MDEFYHYDPSSYYTNEDDTSSSTGSKIQFEFGASASLSTSTPAQAQKVRAEDPLLEDNTQAKFWIGMTVTIVIVTVRSEATRPFYKA